MTSYIVQRLFHAVVVMIIVSIFVFLAMRLLPGDPLTIYVGQRDMEVSTPEQIDFLKHKFGLDKPMLVQYIDWVTGIFRGELGTSIFFEEKVEKLIGERLPPSMFLGLSAFILSTIFGILAGLFAALRRGTWLDSVLTIFANIGITVPIFWLAILLIYGFGVSLGWLPRFGYTSPFDDFWLSIRQAIMPVICLSVFSLASTARQTRSSMLEVVQQDYIRTAWAKGLREKIIVTRHVLKNGLIPIVTLLGVQLRMIFGGQVLIEQVFNIPGIGRLLVSGVFEQDYAVVQSGVMVIAVSVVMANLLVDISYGWINPKIRYE